MADPLICLGVITGPHGVRGQVKIKYFTETPEGLTEYGALYDRQGKRSFHFQIMGEVKGQVIGALEGVTDRNEAEKLKGTELFIPRNALPDTESDEEYYYEDLVGLDVILASGESYGKVLQVRNYGAGDMLELATAEGERQLFAFTRASFPQIDMQAGTILFMPPEEVEAREE